MYCGKLNFKIIFLKSLELLSGYMQSIVYDLGDSPLKRNTLL